MYKRYLSLRFLYLTKLAKRIKSIPDSDMFLVRLSIAARTFAIKIDRNVKIPRLVNPIIIAIIFLE